MGARHFGPASWGVFWAAFNLAQIMSRLADLGTHLAMAREIARDGNRAPAARRASRRAKLVLAAAALPLALIASRLIGLPLAIAAVLAAAHLCLSYTEWLGHYLRGFGLVVRESLLLALDCVLAFLCGAAALLLDGGMLVFALSQLLAHALALGAALAAASPSGPAGGPAPRGELGRFLNRAYPVGIALLAPLGSWRLGALALASRGAAGAAQAGLFSVAHRLLEAARFGPTAAAAAAFPAFARRSPEAGPRLLLSVLLPLSVLAAALLAQRDVASALIVLLYGPAFRPAQRAFSVLMWAFPVLTVNAVLSHWLIARGDERFTAAMAGIHLAVHVAALALLVPGYGAAGASASLLAAEAALAGAMSLRILLGGPRRPASPSPVSPAP